MFFLFASSRLIQNVTSREVTGVPSDQLYLRSEMLTTVSLSE